MTGFMPFVLFMLVVSIAVERVAEIVRDILERPNSTDDKDPKFPVNVELHLAAFGAGTLIAIALRAQLRSIVPREFQDFDWPAFLIVGLLAAGGSAIWKDLLTTTNGLAKRVRARSRSNVGTADARIEMLEIRIARAREQQREAEFRAKIAETEYSVLRSRL